MPATPARTIGAVTHEHEHSDVVVPEGWTPEDYWNDRYGGGQVWSGAVNPTLVRYAGDLAPGRALELGCGEGGDAIWLAAQGWDVLAVDLSQVALDRAARHAAESGVADRVRWEQHDLDADFPRGEFDLVSAHYLHSPVALAYERLVRNAAAAVAPGGTLLVVGHHGAQWRDASMPEVRSATADDVVAAAREVRDDWVVVERALVERPGAQEHADDEHADEHAGDGHSGSAHPHRFDVVVRLARPA